MLHTIHQDMSGYEMLLATYLEADYWPTYDSLDISQEVSMISRYGQKNPSSKNFTSSDSETPSEYMADRSPGAYEEYSIDHHQAKGFIKEESCCGIEKIKSQLSNIDSPKNSPDENMLDPQVHLKDDSYISSNGRALKNINCV